MGKGKPKYIYTSPDGGLTVYQHELGSDVKETIQQDEHMCGWQAIEERQRHPALQEAWERYKTLWRLCVTDDD